MNRRCDWNRSAQLLVVMLAALVLKLYYSAASADQLRWVLAPTTFMVRLCTGISFEFEAHAGYISADHSFLIAAPCAGVNFLITAFLMLSLTRLWSNRARQTSWLFLPLAALVAFAVTVVANTVRISTALQTARLSLGWLSGKELHRLEGIVVYFGFLLVLFWANERVTAYECHSFQNHSDSPDRLRLQPDRLRRGFPLMRASVFPLLIYYATALGIPLANGAYRQGSEFWEHSLFVLVIPCVLLAPLAAYRFCKRRRSSWKNSEGYDAKVEDRADKCQRFSVIRTRPVGGG